MTPMSALRRRDERRLERLVRGRPRPAHIGIVMDGNRRCARQVRFTDPRVGHRFGSAHVARVLGWCRELGVREVTVFVASTDNLVNREQDEVLHLVEVVEEITADELSRGGLPVARAPRRAAGPAARLDGGRDDRDRLRGPGRDRRRRALLLDEQARAGGDRAPESDDNDCR